MCRMALRVGTISSNSVSFLERPPKSAEIALAIAVAFVRTRSRSFSRAASRRSNAGAGVLRTMDEPDMGHYAVVLQDPEGNEFCVV